MRQRGRRLLPKLLPHFYRTGRNSVETVSTVEHVDLQNGSSKGLFDIDQHRSTSDKREFTSPLAHAGPARRHGALVRSGRLRIEEAEARRGTVQTPTEDWYFTSVLYDDEAGAGVSAAGDSDHVEYFVLGGAVMLAVMGLVLLIVSRRIRPAGEGSVSQRAPAAT